MATKKAPPGYQRRTFSAAFQKELERQLAEKMEWVDHDKIPTLPLRWLTKEGKFVGSGFHHLWCAKCWKFIASAGHHRIIKNRNDARFWGLPEKKALCGACLGTRKAEMPARKRWLWNEYCKRGYWEKG